MFWVKTALVNVQEWDLLCSWQLVGHFITDVIQVWIVTDSPAIYVPIVFSSFRHMKSFSGCFREFFLNIEEAVWGSVSFVFSFLYSHQREKAVCIGYSWHFSTQQLILHFDFPFILIRHYHFSLTWFKWWLASVQPLCPYLRSVIHPLPMCLGKW